APGSSAASAVSDSPLSRNVRHPAAVVMDLRFATSLSQAYASESTWSPLPLLAASSFWQRSLVATYQNSPGLRCLPTAALIAACSACGSLAPTRKRAITSATAALLVPTTNSPGVYANVGWLNPSSTGFSFAGSGWPFGP